MDGYMTHDSKLIPRESKAQLRQTQGREPNILNNQCNRSAAPPQSYSAKIGNMFSYIIMKPKSGETRSNKPKKDCNQRQGTPHYPSWPATLDHREEFVFGNLKKTNLFS